MSAMIEAARLRARFLGQNIMANAQLGTSIEDWYKGHLIAEWVWKSERWKRRLDVNVYPFRLHCFVLRGREEGVEENNGP
eukprot:6994199-Pyramimonas_sp.AAC.1